MKFKKDFTIDQRNSEYQRIIQKYPDRIPVICKNNNKEINLNKSKFLVPKDFTISQFLLVLRKRINLSPEKALFILVDNNILPPNTDLMSDVYNRHKDSNGLLIVYVSLEAVFG